MQPLLLLLRLPLILFLLSLFVRFQSIEGIEPPPLDPKTLIGETQKESDVNVNGKDGGFAVGEPTRHLTTKNQQRRGFRSTNTLQNGQVPDPNRVADPSLLPVHLQKPDYRPLSGGLKAGGPKPATETEAGVTPKTSEDSSATVMSMGGEEAEEEAEKKTEEAKVAEEEAKAKEEEAKGAAEEAEAKQKEAEDAEKEAETKQQEAAAEAEEEAETTTTTTEAPAEEEAEETSSPMPEPTMEDLIEAIESAKLVVQNITLVLPTDSPSLQAFLNALLAGRPQTEYSPQLLPPSASPLPAARSGTPFFDPPIFTAQPYANCRPFSASSASLYPFRPQSAPLPAIQIDRQLNYLVDVEQLHGWIKSGRKVKVLDASYEPDPGTADHVQFYAEYYAKWDRLIRDKKSRQYERSHIPDALPFNLNIATYSSWNERQALYPADKFEQYIQRLGIDKGDQLVIYARGALGGMLHAARAWQLFRIYGHEKVVVLDGGLEAWRKADLPANDAAVEASLGNWKAHFRAELVVTFEELTSAESDGYCILSRLYWYNFLNASPRNEFFGLSQPNPMGVQRNGMAGTKPFPADELVVDGLLVSTEEILRKLQQIGYSRAYQTIVMGNTADEASLALLAIAQAGDTRAKLYNGGMEEIRRRAPYLMMSNR